MALNLANLSVLAYSNGFTLWHYKTADVAADVDTSGYFNNASGILRVGDRIMAAVDTGGTAAYGDFWVQSNSSGVVDVFNITSATATDSD